MDNPLNGIDFKSAVPIAGIIAGFTVVGMLWSNIKACFGGIYNLIIIEATLSERTYEIVYDYLAKNNKINNMFRTREIDCYWLFYKPANKQVHLPVERGGGFIMFFNNGFPVIMSKFFDKDKNIRYKTSYLRNTLDFNSLIRDAFLKNIALYTTEMNRVFTQRFIGTSVKENESNNEGGIESPAGSVDYGYTLVGFSNNDTKSNIQENSASNYCFSKECKEALEFAKKWKESKPWYNEKMIPWKTGFCLIGAPGTGKSSFCKVISSELNMPIFIFDIATMSNEEFVNFWKRAQTNTPCIALIEDIDRVFDKDKNITTGDVNKQHLTFDCLLNCISGVENNEGIISIVTANNADRIDVSLGKIDGNGHNSRPGRMDFILHFDVLDEECRQTLAQKMLKEFPECINSVVAEGNGDTGAQFVNRCAVLALNKYWKSIGK